MNFALQPLSMLPLPKTIEAGGFSMEALQKGLALKPPQAYQTAGPAAGKATGSSLNPLHPSLNPLHPVLNPLSGTKTHSDSEIKKVSKDFESIFIRMLLNEMHKSVEKSGLLGNSRAMEFFESMQDDQMSGQMASAGGLGIGKIIYQRLKASTTQHQKVFS